VARTVLSRGRPFAPLARPAIVDGAAGAVVSTPGGPVYVVSFAIEDDRIAEIGIKLRALPSS